MRAEEVMKKIRSLHLQAIYNAGAVRQVDRILAELLMAQFTRVNQIIGTDLNTSLQELFTVVETSRDTLLEELKMGVFFMTACRYLRSPGIPRCFRSYGEYTGRKFSLYGNYTNSKYLPFQRSS